MNASYELSYTAALERLQLLPDECPFCGEARASRAGGHVSGRQPRTCGKQVCIRTFRRAYQEDYDAAHPRAKGTR